ncbi:MAG: Hpt domain-containing protein, partial [Pseudorhizobium sp.]
MSFPDPIAVFRIEAAELLEQIEAGLLDLNVNLGDKDQVDTVFRSLHTLKGSGAMFGFDALAGFTHHCETAFDRVRKGEVPATHDLVGAVLEAKDHMRLLVDMPSGDHDAASEALLASLRRAVEGAGAPVVENGPRDTRYTIRFSLPQNAMANGTNPLGLLDELRELGDCRIVADRSAIPPLDELNPTDLHLSWTVDLTTSEPRSAIDDVFIFVMDEMELEVLEIGHEPQGGQPAVTADIAPAEQAAPAASRQVPANLPTTVDAKAAKAAENVRVPA